MNTIEIGGQQYEVIKAKPFQHNGKERIELTLRKPKGRKLYFATVYENGAVSEVA